MIMTDIHKVRILREALGDLLMVIRTDELIPESVSYMQAAQDAMDRTTPGKSFKRGTVS
jgi:hypothetical protein